MSESRIERQSLGNELRLAVLAWRKRCSLIMRQRPVNEAVRTRRDKGSPVGLNTAVLLVCVNKAPDCISISSRYSRGSWSARANAAKEFSFRKIRISYWNHSNKHIQLCTWYSEVWQNLHFLKGQSFYLFIFFKKLTCKFCWNSKFCRKFCWYTKSLRKYYWNSKFCWKSKICRKFFWNMEVC